MSKTLDEAIFGLPVGELSPIIEDEQGLHIVRVIERKEAYRTPFIEAQAEITELLRGERVQKQLNEYVSRLKKETPIWTVYRQAGPGRCRFEQLHGSAKGTGRPLSGLRE